MARSKRSWARYPRLAERRVVLRGVCVVCPMQWDPGSSKFISLWLDANLVHNVRRAGEA